MKKKTDSLPAFNGVSVSKIEIQQNGDLSVEFDLPTPVDLQNTAWRTDIQGKRTFDVYEDPEMLEAAKGLFRVLQKRMHVPDPARVGIDCMKCTESSCCREYDVFIDSEDVKRLSAHVKLDLKGLLAKHIDERPDWSGDFKYRLRRVKDGDRDRCTFLLRDEVSGRMRCSIYEGRPNLCRSFDERDCTLYDGE
jgi:Fe-S-cluster containining protein